MDDFTQGYIECALWLADESPGPGEWSPHDAYTLENIDPDSLARMMEDCTTFQRLNRADLDAAACLYDIRFPEVDASMGHDFYLTRNRHGAGFWDRDLGDVGERLTTAAHDYGESDLSVGDDGHLYLS